MTGVGVGEVVVFYGGHISAGARNGLLISVVLFIYLFFCIPSKLLSQIPVMVVLLYLKLLTLKKSINNFGNTL